MKTYVIGRDVVQLDLEQVAYAMRVMPTLPQQLGITKQAVSQWVTGQTSPLLAKAERLRELVPSAFVVVGEAHRPQQKFTAPPEDRGKRFRSSPKKIFCRSLQRVVDENDGGWVPLEQVIERSNLRRDAVARVLRVLETCDLVQLRTGQGQGRELRVEIRWSPWLRA